MPQAPDEVQVEFGLDLHAEVGAFIAAAKLQDRHDLAAHPAIVHPTADWFPITTTVGEMTG